MTIPKSEALKLLKYDVGIMPNISVYDPLLLSMIEQAVESIEAEGIILTDSYNDLGLIRMYAAYLWRKRDTGEGMGEMLRLALNNRILKDLAADDETGDE